MKKSSIAGRFILIVLLILLIGQGLLWVWFVNGQKTYYAETLKEKIRITANLLAVASESSISSFDYSNFDKHLEAALKDEDLVSVKLLDPKGAVLREKMLKPLADESSFIPFFIPVKNTYSLPIRSGSETIGTVEIIYSGQKANNDIRKLLTVSPFGQIIVFIFVVYAIYFFFQKKVGRPVGILNSEIRRATSGDLTVKIPEFGQNEIGDIANGLGILIDRLALTIDRLRSISENVSMAINQLNLTFRNVTDGTQRQTVSIQSVLTSIKQAKELHEHMTEDAGKLADFSNENVTSLLEMKATADEVAASTNKLYRSTEDVYSIVAEMSQTAKTIAANTEETSSSVIETSASIEEINASVREVESSAKQSAGLATRVTEVASEVGMMSVVDAIEGMEKISEEVKHTAEIISRLGTRSADIEKILSVIKDVTEQTNLLSLNAAILAAQAGEYGRSFSVVADEIRGLSDRTASSTRDISNIIKTIQTEISQAVKAIDSGMGKVDEGSSMVYKVGDALRETLTASEQSADMARAIEKATEEQATGLKQVAVAINNIQRMMGQVAKATQEQQRGTAHLLETVSDIKDAADIVNQGTEEEATSIKMISKNLELADERVRQIGQSTANQQKANENIMTAIEQIKSIGVAAERDVEGVSMSLRTLHDEIDLLKHEMDAFKTGKKKDGEDT